MKNKINIFIICLFSSYLYNQDSIDPVYTGSFGSVTINNQVYNHFSIRPEHIYVEKKENTSSVNSLVEVIENLGHEKILCVKIVKSETLLYQHRILRQYLSFFSP